MSNGTTDENYAAISKYRLRDVLAPKGDLRWYDHLNVPIQKVALELVHNLNGSVNSWYNETMPRPMSGITFSDRNEMPFWHETYFAKSLAYNFLQCSKNGLVAESSDPFLIFQPFDAWTWGYLALSSLTLCLILKHFKLHIPSFIILRAMLQPSSDSKSCNNWITSSLVIMWTFGCLFLVNFYSSEIQSLYVVPTKLEPFQNFKQVQQASYRLLRPHSSGSVDMGLMVTKQSSLNYWYGLENTAELVKRVGEDEERFWTIFFGSSDRVFPDKGDLIENVANFVNDIAESKRCFVGKEPIAARYWFWFVSGPNVGMIRSHLGHLGAAGIMQWYVSLFSQKSLAQDMIYIKRAIREPALAFVEKRTVGSYVITIQDLKMIFIYAGFGLLSSFMVFTFAATRRCLTKTLQRMLRHYNRWQAMKHPTGLKSGDKPTAATSLACQ